MQSMSVPDDYRIPVNTGWLLTEYGQGCARNKEQNGVLETTVAYCTESDGFGFQVRQNQFKDGTDHLPQSIGTLR